jgi:hypothetical protein
MISPTAPSTSGFSGEPTIRAAVSTRPRTSTATNARSARGMRVASDVRGIAAG